MASLDRRRPVRPKAIDTAFLFTVTGTVLGSIGTVLTTLVDRARMAAMVRDALSRSGEPYTEADVLAMIGPFRIAGAITIAAGAGMLVLLAVKVRAGRNWARLLLAVLVLVGVFDFAGAVAAEGAALVLIWHLAAVAFGVAAVVYLFRAESSTYFARRRESR
ncbi:MAG TPA: hypothetical protein VGX25_08835 [Actinophytocola sp.]|uniref:hypothetical protein n=1 Tax=Actinophytocola sp. TaxID=1872138 RepID=UPI002DDD1099|nr:hypothetical protein [Actinophytocola sp.]HEV2779493.1 hypothetical protein [Actinophytocola sp.]